MTTPPLDLTALRELADSQGNHWGITVQLSAAKLAALLDRVEGWMKRAEDASMARLEALTRAEAAEKAVAAVRELHALDTHVCECGDTHGPYCKTCQYDYPCPTITALDGGA